MLNNSSFLFDSNKKIDKSNSKRKLFEPGLKDLIINDNNENKNIDEDITSLSVPSEKEDYLNLYKIPKTKIINDISSIELNGNNRMKESKEPRNQKRKFIISKDIIKEIFSLQKINVEDKITMISELNKEFSISKRDNLNDKINLEKNSIDKFKKRQINLKKKIVKNLKSFIKTNQEKKNINNNLNNNNANKINKIKKIFERNNKKAGYERNKKNINHIGNILTGIPGYFYKNEKNKTHKEKRYINNMNKINNNIIPSFISLKNGNYKKKIDTNSTFYKKLKINSIKSKKSNYSKTKKKGTLNNINESFDKINSISHKILKEYFSQNKNKKIFLNENNTFLKNKKINLINLRNKLNAGNKTLNHFLCKKKENLGLGEKNRNVIKITIKKYIDINDNKVINYCNTII